MTDIPPVPLAVTPIEVLGRAKHHRCGSNANPLWRLHDASNSNQSVDSNRGEGRTSGLDNRRGPSLGFVGVSCSNAAALRDVAVAFLDRAILLIRRMRALRKVTGLGAHCILISNFYGLSHNGYSVQDHNQYCLVSARDSGREFAFSIKIVPLVHHPTNDGECEGLRSG